MIVFGWGRMLGTWATVICTRVNAVAIRIGMSFSKLRGRSRFTLFLLSSGAIPTTTSVRFARAASNSTIENKHSGFLPRRSAMLVARRMTFKRASHQSAATLAQIKVHRERLRTRAKMMPHPLPVTVEEENITYYFDESGDFAVPSSQDEHRVGIVMGVVIPHETEVETLRGFERFVSSLPPASFHNGEPKGKLLDFAARAAFADLIAGCDGILVCPIVLDLTALAGRGETHAHGLVVKKLEALAGCCKHPRMREQMALLGRQFKRLSLPQSLRLAAWARCIMRSLHDSIIAHSGERFHGSWNHLLFDVDPVQQSAGNREGLVFDSMVLAWVCAWSEGYPFVTIEGVHNANHPFTQNFETAAGIDFGKMIRGNLHFTPSNTNKGIQIADMAATIIAKVTRGIADARDFYAYGRMMTKAIGRPLYATGLFSFVEPDAAAWQRRFYGLPESIDAARRHATRIVGL